MVWNTIRCTPRKYSGTHTVFTLSTICAALSLHLYNQRTKILFIQRKYPPIALSYLLNMTSNTWVLTWIITRSGVSTFESNDFIQEYYIKPVTVKHIYFNNTSKSIWLCNSLFFYSNPMYALPEDGVQSLQLKTSCTKAKKHTVY